MILLIFNQGLPNECFPLMHFVLHCFDFFSTRKLRGTLNFDNVDVGLVSDSMVANSLYLQNQNGSLEAPVKTEQPDL